MLERSVLMSCDAAGDRLRQVDEALAPLRRDLLEHPIYTAIRTLPDLHHFMEHHVFAVWDFMCLTKTLQRQLTSTVGPWVPVGDPLTRRLINETVLSEESDLDGSGGFLSHFELYREAMLQCGADCTAIDRFLATLEEGAEIEVALASRVVPEPSRSFVTATVRGIARDTIHSIAAAFTWGREEIIPKMFHALAAHLNRDLNGRLALFVYYLERHVEVDTESHFPFAEAMTSKLCGDDPVRWQESIAAAQAALRARIAFWDRILLSIPSRLDRQAALDPTHAAREGGS